MLFFDLLCIFSQEQNPNNTKWFHFGFPLKPQYLTSSSHFLHNTSDKQLDDQKQLADSSATDRTCSDWEPQSVITLPKTPT